MREITLMDPSKETENKLRWSGDVEGVAFKLYIPKTRVPKPWPRRVHVTVSEQLSQPEEAVASGGGDAEQPIVCVVKKVVEHTETVRYCPSAIQRRGSWESPTFQWHCFRATLRNSSVSKFSGTVVPGPGKSSGASSAERAAQQ